MAGPAALGFMSTSFIFSCVRSAYGEFISPLYDYGILYTMKTSFLVLILIVCLCAWCPWLTQTQAIALTQAKAQGIEQNLIGCTLTRDPTTIAKAAFGYTENFSFSCALENQQLTQGEEVVFISFFNWVFGMPEPIIK